MVSPWNYTLRLILFMLYFTARIIISPLLLPRPRLPTLVLSSPTKRDPSRLVSVVQFTREEVNLSLG